MGHTPAHPGDQDGPIREPILIVDDDANSRLLLSTLLAAEGYTVQQARSGEEALDWCQRHTPCAVILDVRLPGINGFEVCRRLKSDERGLFLPIVMATALRGNEQRIMGVEAGADDFIGKPYNRVELATRIKSLLRIQKLHRALEEKVSELEAAKEKLSRLAVTDGLTGLFNYRAFQTQLRLELSRSRRFALPLSLLMIDIDHFKRFNDQYGHPAGDRLLQLLAKLFKSNLRDVDVPVRYGGEEFAVILPGTDKGAATTVAEKLRRLVAEIPLTAEGFSGTNRRVTISLGVATHPQDATNEELLIRLADEALYEAKKNGRNQWQAHGAQPTS